MTEFSKNTQVPQCDKTAVSRSVTLLPMVEFVLEIRKKGKSTVATSLNLIFKYADFLKQPLKLWMFIPCELVGDNFANWQPIKEPVMFYSDENIKKLKGVEIDIANEVNEKVKIFKKAKNECLFQGFSVFKRKDYFVLLADDYPNNHEIWVSWNESKTIEDLIYLSPKLTNNASDILGLSDSI